MTTRRKARLRIIQISAEYPPDPGGVGDYTQLLSRTLIARGHRLTVLTGGTPSRRSQQVVESGDPNVCPVVRAWDWLATAPLLQTIVERRPDVVHIQYQTGAYVMHPAINMLPWRIHRLHNAPQVVVTAHDLRVPYLLPKAGWLRHWVTRRLLADADARIVTNAADQIRLAGGSRPDDPDIYHSRTPLPATVIPIGSNIAPEPPAGYDRAEWRRRLGIEDEEIVFVFFGLATPSKGLLEVIEIMAALPPIARLLVVGGEGRQGPDLRYAVAVKQAVESLGLAERVIFTGYCDPATVSAHLMAADVGALPFRDGASYRRGSLLALLAHGVPLVTTQPEGPLTPPLIDDRHALLVAPGDTMALRQAGRRLLVEPELRARLSSGARLLHDHFAWPSIAAAHEDVYNTLLERHVLND